jgi:hypothetical protein
MTKTRIVIIIIGVSLIVILPLTIYFYHFNGTLSDKPSDWGSFGSYISPFVSLAYTILIAVLTYLLVTIEMARDKPTLIIGLLKPKLTVYNIGKAQAVNIKVIAHFNDKPDYIQPLNSLVPTDSYAFETPPAGTTGVTVEYESIHGVKYKTIPSLQLSNEFGFQLSNSEANILFRK